LLTFVSSKNRRALTGWTRSAKTLDFSAIYRYVSLLHQKTSNSRHQDRTSTASLRPRILNHILTTRAMSFDQLSSLESQPTTTRRQDDPQYTDDPEFQKLSQELMTKLFSLSGSISRLNNEVGNLGTKRDTERLRERVHDLLEETKDSFKDLGDGVKKLQSWEDVSVCSVRHR
jgi:ElaB/YqjD/DUF883 family membrane-anchored ribosome-binding protein